jgi:hypothetical protein
MLLLRVGAITVAMLVAIAVYAVSIGNVGVFRNGCFLPYPGLTGPLDTTPHFESFPPRFVCLYKTKAGKVVYRRD